MVSSAPPDCPPSENATILQEQAQADGSATSQDPTSVSIEQESELTHEPPASSEDPGSSEDLTSVPAPTPAPAPAPAPAQPPKQVFSLFLTPEERKKKLESEATAATVTTTTGAAANGSSSKRGKKPKGKGPTTHQTSAPGPPATSKASNDPKAHVDPNISKTGETHRFFQEVKASQQQAAVSQNGAGSMTESNHRPKRYDSKPQETPFPLKHQQFHGSDAIDEVNSVVARLCGLSTSISPVNTAESLFLSKIKRDPDTQCGWYSLRTSPDLGITAPHYTLKPRGKGSWTHWGKDRDQKWRRWSEKRHRLQKPTDKERRLILRESNATQDFESCQRVAEDHHIWQQTWASTLLTTTGGLEPGSSEVDTAVDLKTGELWTEKYKPTQGADVLGNRANTEYLTQWLKKLEVSGWTLNPDESGTAGPGPGSAKKIGDIMGLARKRRKRPKRKGEMDDFIAFEDDDDFEDPYGDLSDEDDGLFAAPKPLSSFDRIAQRDLPTEDDAGHPVGMRLLPRSFEIKSNTILLSGPAGSCKTSAVYACAEECGYEVFEVSPGMRRTGKEVLGLVGEMAENHHVHVVPGKMDTKEDIANIMGTKHPDSPAPAVPASAPSTTIHSFFQKRQSNQKKDEAKHETPQDEDESMEEASDIDVEGMDDQGSPGPHSLSTRQTRSMSRQTSASAKEGDDEEPSTKDEAAFSDLYSLLANANPRQSLILLEEIDILFEDDKGFWASIVTLLSKSKRPVVMTCNDITKIPAATLRFQEHLEFTRPCLRELHQYLSCVCKIEGFICSSEYIFGLIKHCRHDVRKCIMQLQYDAGVIRTRPELAGPSSGDATGGHGHIKTGTLANTSDNGGNIGSPTRKKPQRLLRISAKGIVPASTPTFSASRKLMSSPMQELEQLELHAQYAEAMSLYDSELRIKPGRIVQCYEMDQYEATKDDIVGQQYFAVYKRPSGSDHLLMDQEIGALVEEADESLYLTLAQQQGLTNPHVFEDSTKKDEPSQLLADNFTPHDDEALFMNVQRMQPALEQTLSLQGLRFNLDATFGLYAPLLRSMIHSEAINAMVPTGKRTMRSGGHLKRHLETLSDSERNLMLLTTLSLPQT